MQSFCKAVLLVVTFVFAVPARADIILDYRHDTARGGGGYFNHNPTAKAALEAAAAHINGALRLNNSLSSISEAQNDVTGLSGPAGFQTEATNAYRLTYSNPQTGASETWDPFSLGTDEIRVFVGMRNLTGSTLGQGGTGGFGYTLSGLIFDENDWPGAIADMEAQSNTILGRGHGPVISTLNGSSTVGSTTANFSISKGATHGNLWFDSDSNDNGVFDSDAELEDYWHFDHTTDVAAGKNDFFSVAVHEILHAIGFGTSESWDDLISGTEGDGNDDDWLGSDGIAANGGSGVDLIDDGHGHIASGTSSFSIIDGAVQDAVMTPSITVGTRKYLTYLDVAMLRDIGYTNARAVPEPTSLAMISLISLGGAVFYRRRKLNRVGDGLAA